MMGRQFTFLALVTVVAVTVATRPGTSAQTGTSKKPQTYYPQLIQIGQGKFESGDFAGAVKTLQDVIDHADALDIQFDAMFLKATVLKAWSSTEKAKINEEAKINEAIEAYRKLILHDELPTCRRAIAHNNLGMIYFEREEFEKAFAQFEIIGKIDPKKACNAQHRAIYKFNQARALENLPDLDPPERAKRAFDCYVEAVHADPNLDAAIERAFGTLWKATDPKVDDAAKLATFLVGHGRGDVAAKRTRDFLVKWRDAPAADQLLIPLVQHYASKGTTKKQFRASDADFLANATRDGSKARKMVDNIKDVYFDLELKPTLEIRIVRDRYSVWLASQDSQEAFSRFAKVVADQQLRHDKPDVRGAFARYCLGWTIDPNNTSAGLYLVSVLRDYEKDLLVGKEGDWATQFAYALASDTAERPYSLDDQIRMHVVLGHLFEHRKLLGPLDRPATAVFQYEQAVKAESQLPADVRTPSPGLHVRLARIYSQIKEKDMMLAAWDHYVTAAEMYAGIEEKTKARGALGAAHMLPLKLDEKRFSRLKNVETRIQPQTVTVSGKVVSVKGEKLTIEGNNGKEHTHEVVSTAKITFDGKACKLSDLKEGVRILVTVDDTNRATRIEAFLKDNPPPRDK